jgi:hypothetical protein
VPDVVTTETVKFGGYVGAGYDYGWLVARYIRATVADGKPVSGSEIISRLRAESRVQTPVNGYIFKDDGDTVRPLAIFGVADGSRKLLKPFGAVDLQN